MIERKKKVRNLILAFTAFITMVFISSYFAVRNGKSIFTSIAFGQHLINSEGNTELSEVKTWHPPVAGPVAGFNKLGKTKTLWAQGNLLRGVEVPDSNPDDYEEADPYVVDSPVNDIVVWNELFFVATQSNGILIFQMNNAAITEVNSPAISYESEACFQLLSDNVNNCLYSIEKDGLVIYAYSSDKSKIEKEDSFDNDHTRSNGLALYQVPDSTRRYLYEIGSSSALDEDWELYGYKIENTSSISQRELLHTFTTFIPTGICYYNYSIYVAGDLCLWRFDNIANLTSNSPTQDCNIIPKDKGRTIDVDYDLNPNVPRLVQKRTILG
ncbi:MAG: hypothetical protein JXI43_12955 [Tissierellales bacterium]|nr:hypothetical protein [Tissierellales bacterium]